MMRRALRLLKWFVLIVLLTYGASNLWLSSRWATGMAESKLKARTGFDWQVGSMSWSPWNGVTISDARMLQPAALRADLEAPVVKVDRIRVKPYWSQLLRGRVRPHEVIVEAPELTLSVEMLASLAARVAPQKLQPSPTPAGAGPAVEEKPEPLPPVKTDPPQTGKKPPSPNPAAPQVPAEATRPPAGMPSHLSITNAGVHIVSVSKGVELLRMQNISLDLPLFGEDSGGVVRIPTMKVPGLPELVDVEQHIVWKRPYLELEEQTVDMAGLKVRFLAQLGMGRGAMGRLPFLFDLVVDPQQLDALKWFERMALEVNAEQLAGRFRVNGALTSPMSWRADGVVIGKNIGVREIHGSHDVVFDRVYVPAVFRQGQLRWTGARMIGEDISILGNGRISVGDGILSVTRLVVSPEVSEMLSRGMHGAGLVRNGLRWWDDLDTPDRKVRDLLVSGSLVDPVMDAGYQHTDVPVWEIVFSTLKFIREEMKEEGKELAPLPNKELLERKQHANH